MATKKIFIPLENNPETLTQLAHTLGLSPSLIFHDVYSLTEPSLLAHIPRPCYALVGIIPLTPIWNADREAEDKDVEYYNKCGPEEPILWFEQTITHACGLLSLIHATVNLPLTINGSPSLLPSTPLSTLRTDAVPLARVPRAALLSESDILEAAHYATAVQGDTVPPDPHTFQNGLHFVTWIKGSDGRLWELEGGRKGPVERGWLSEDEDLLSAKAVELGIGRILKLDQETTGGEGGDMRFSCVALAQHGAEDGKSEERALASA